VAEDALDRGAHVTDRGICFDDHDHVRGVLDQRGEACLALAERATSVRAGLPVLLYSGNAEGFEAAELERSGVRGALRKPVDAKMLRVLVARWLTADG